MMDKLSGGEGERGSSQHEKRGIEEWEAAGGVPFKLLMSERIVNI